ncbi:MAG: AAA family ATPase, partial [Bacteroidia bacterium]|nr:AAA family ATPase [Bacteroidia bacterium]
MKIKLKKVTIEKYTCIETKQEFDIDPNVTVLVGMNESGKTSVLKALAKTNYFDDDSDFEFNLVHDYPRKEKKALDKSKEIPVALIGEYEISNEMLAEIAKNAGPNTFKNATITYSIKYDNTGSYLGYDIDTNAFIQFKLNSIGINNTELVTKLITVKNTAELEKLISESTGDELKKKLKDFSKYYENKWTWENPIEEFILRTYLDPNMPKFLYYDEYYSLPSVISIEKIVNSKKMSEETKTAKALFELADINAQELIASEDFESYKAELEATQAIISETLFTYWTTNTNIEINFDVEKIISKDTPPVNPRLVKWRETNRRVPCRRSSTREAKSPARTRLLIPKDGGGSILSTRERSVRRHSHGKRFGARA